MKLKSVSLLILLAGLFFACNVEKNLGKKWNGKTKDELIQKMGAPEKTSEDGRGGEILTYTEIVNRPVSRASNGRTYTVNVRFRDTTMYFVNKEGKIYNVVQKSDELG